MPQFVVFRVDKNVTPPDGTKGSADFYMGTHADEATAVQSAAVQFGVAPGTYLWVDLAANLHRYMATLAVSVG